MNQSRVAQNGSPPLVSILIPCFNAESWISHAIESALSQTWPNKEVIVFDDGSTDGSVEIIRQYSDKIRWESGANRGANIARNRLKDISEGSFIQYLDADDYLLPDKISSQLQSIEAAVEIPDVIFSPMTLEFWSNGLAQRREQLPISDPDDPWTLLGDWSLPGTHAVLFRREAINEVGGWKPDQPCCQEHELFLRLLMAGKRFSYCPIPGAIYRQWSEQTLCKKNKSEVHRRRLEILQRSEKWLKDHDELTASRLRAINQTRFETARGLWQSDPATAKGVIHEINVSKPGFIPSGKASPIPYVAAYRLLGFDFAERLANWTREQRKFAMRLFNN